MEPVQCALPLHNCMVHSCELVTSAPAYQILPLQEDTEEKVEEKKRQLYEEDIDAILARAEVNCWSSLS